VIIYRYNFWKARPKQIGTAKNRPKFGAISDNFRLWSRISPERINRSNIGKALDHLQPLPRWTKKVSPQTKQLLTVINLHPNGLFSGDYISALFAFKFSRVLEIDPALLAHTPNWDGGPPKNFNRENLKFGLKIGMFLIIYNPSHFGRKIRCTLVQRRKIIDSNVCSPYNGFFR